MGAAALAADIGQLPFHGRADRIRLVPAPVGRVVSPELEPALGKRTPEMLRAGPDSTDQELVEAAKRDRGAFAHLYDRYVDRIYSYAYHRTGNRELAEDVTADTFRSAIEGLARYEWRGVPFAAWLYRIASNNIAMHYRKAVPQDSIDDMDLPAHDAESPESLAERGERAAMLKKAMAGLTAEQQQVVTLRFGQGLKAAQIGLIMDKSEGAVKLLLHRAMRSMQRHLRAEMM